MFRSRLLSISIVLLMTGAAALHWWTSPRQFEVQARLRLPHNSELGGLAVGLEGNQKLSASVVDATCAALKQQSIVPEGRDLTSMLQTRYRFSVHPEGEHDEVLLTYTTPASEIDSALLTVQATLDAWCRSLGQPSASAAGAANVAKLVTSIEAKRTQVALLSRPVDGLPSDDAGRAAMDQELQSLQTAIAEARLDRDESGRMRQLIQQAVAGQTTFEIAAGKLTDPRQRATALALVRRGQRELEWKQSQVKLAKFETIYGSAHPRMIELQRDIDTLQEEFGDSMPTDETPVANRMLAIVTEDFEKRERALSQLTTRLTGVAERQQKSADQSRKLQAARAELAELEARHATVVAEVQRAQFETPRAEILAAPVLQPDPVSPLLWQELGLGLVCGLVLARIVSIRRK